MFQRLLPVLLILGLAPHPAAAEDDLLILEIRLDQRVLASGVAGILQDERILLPLGEVVRALDFAIEVDPAAGTAEGWFLREDRTFSLDCEVWTARIEGRSFPFDSGQVARRDEDLYVDSALLGTWFPVRFEADLPHLSILLVPQEKLPFQLQQERRTRLQGRPSDADRRFPEMETPYRFLDWPVLEGNLTWHLAGAGTSLVHDAHWTGDLLGMTGDLWASGEQPVRLSLGRKDPEGRLLGPWRATEIGVGSLFLPSRGLVFGAQPIQGALLSSFPLEEAERDELTTLSGHAPPGWEIELYREDTLLDLQTAGADGSYTFSQVPLFLGANLFRLVFHGPQGQQREERRRILVDNTMARPGEIHYRIAAGRLEGALREGERPYAAALEGEIGLGGGLAASLTLDSLERPGSGRRDFAGASLSATRSGVFGHLDLVRALDGGWAASGSLQSLWRRFGFLLQRDQYEGFEAPLALGAVATLRARSHLRLQGLLGGGRARPLSYSLAAEREEQASGVGRQRISGSLAGGVRGLSWSHLLNLDLPASGRRGAWGSLLASGRLGGLLLRGDLSYRVEPEAALDRLAFTVERPFSGGRTLRLGARHTLSPRPDTALAAEAGWLSSHGRLHLAVGYGGSGGWTGRLTLGYSLRRNPLSGRWQLGDPARTSAGAAAVRVFLDRDRDGRFSATDEPLSGVRVRPLEGGARPVDTDRQGNALLAGLPLLKPVNLGIDGSSLTDPAWVPLIEGARLTLRPGAIPRLDVPVAISGEVEGMVRLRHKGEARAAANVRLQLIDPAGRVAGETRSESDGFYLFERVPPGRYGVRVDPDQVRRLRLKTPPEHYVEVGAEGGAVRGMDLDLELLALAT